MRVVLDAGGVSALAGNRELLIDLQLRWVWPPLVPSVVLTESLTGDHRRDHGVDRFLRTCLVHDVDERLAREGARLRTATGRAGEISAVDAIVAALASTLGGGIVLTSDPRDMRALSAQASAPFAVAAL